MNAPFLSVDLKTWAIVWFITAAYLIVRHWRGGQGVGLVLTYVISFGSIHWLGAVLYLVPWYYVRGEDLVAQGMRESAIAMVAFAVGGELLAVWFTWRSHFAPGLTHDPERLHPGETGLSLPVSPGAPRLFLVVGMVLYGVVSPLAGRIPTVSALVNTGSTLVVVGIGLKCWNGWQTGDRRTIWKWLGISTLLPLVTVVAQGYLGYGMAAMVTVSAFVAAFYGPRWKVVTVGILATYLGLSVYVTYMRDRGDIRSIVWNGGTMADRIRQMTDTVTLFEWFDPHNLDHLDRINERLNQDYLIGAAVMYTGGGRVPFAHGATFEDAALALIPRAIWPNKPISAGSGDLVSIYTGLKFGEGTSVGIGQVMECYINFGTTSVVLVFLLIGGLTVLIDRSARQALRFGDAGEFAAWYLPGLSLLLVGGSFVEATSSAAASLAVGLTISAFAKRQIHSTPKTPEPFDYADSSSDLPETWR